MPEEFAFLLFVLRVSHPFGLKLHVNRIEQVKKLSRMFREHQYILEHRYFIVLLGYKTKYIIKREEV